MNEMNFRLYQTVMHKDWNGIVDILLEEDSPYKKACLDKDLYQAKKFIRAGYCINSHLWKESINNCECNMSGCVVEDLLQFPANVLDILNVYMIEDLFHFGLLTKDCIPADFFDMISWNVNFLNKLFHLGLLLEEDITFEVLNSYFKKRLRTKEMDEWFYKHVSVERLEQVLEKN